MIQYHFRTFMQIAVSMMIVVSLYAIYTWNV